MHKPYCCHISGKHSQNELESNPELVKQVSCQNKPEWEIWHDSTPDGYTLACTDHVGALLTDAKEHRVLRIEE